MSDPDPVTSVCPFCSVGCSLAYDPETGRATGRKGAANPDGRLCPKGIRAFDPLDRDDRLSRPLVREGGELRETTWEEALSRAASGLLAVRDEHGPDALAFLGSPHCTNEENYLFQRIARSLGTNNVDNRARICHASAAGTMRERLGCDAMTNSLDDLAEADAFLVIGANPAERQPVAFDAAVRPAVNAGATLIHVDPRANATTRLADYHLAPRPGSDAALLCAMAAVVVGEGSTDGAFVEARTTGFDALARHLDGLDVESVADDAGVDPDDLRGAAQAFAGAERAAAIAGTGVEADDHETTDAADALLNLLLLTGNLGRRGTGMNPFRGLNNEQGAVDMGCRPFALAGGVPVTDDEGRARVAAAWGVEPPGEPGRSELDLVRAFGEAVGGAWVFGENPAVSTLEVDVAARLDALDPLVVQDVFHTETVERADVVLPASAWAEKGGTVTNLDRRVQRTRPAADPPGEARRDLRILCDLGSRLTGRPFDYDGPAAVFEEVTRVTPPYAGMTFAGVAAGGQRWPFPEGADEGVRVLHRDRFETGERRAPLVAVPYAPPDGAADGLALVAGRTVTEFGGVFDGGDDAVRLHPDDADERGIGDGDEVVVSAGGRSVRAVAAVTTDVRPGIAFAHAALADRLDAGERPRVRVARGE